MEPMPRSLKALTAVTAGLLVIALYLVWFYAPREAVMGEVQRVFYFHVAAGWGGGRDRHRLYLDQHRQRFDLGPAHLEHLVDVGPAPGDGYGHGAHLHRLRD